VAVEAPVERRTPVQRSWLDRVGDAASAITRVASYFADLGPTDSAPRTAMYGVEAALDVDRVLFGDPPAARVLRGTSSLAPGERDGAAVPPHLLHQQLLR